MKYTHIEYCIIIIAVVILVLYSSVFETEYSEYLIQLYTKPYWKLLLLLVLISGAIWSPLIGIVIACLLFFYFADVYLLLMPMANTEKALS
jgi:hypothetical protein